MRLVLVKSKSVQLDDCDRVIRCPLRLRDEYIGRIYVFLYTMSLWEIQSSRGVSPSRLRSMRSSALQDNVAASSDVWSERRSATRHCVDDQPARDRLPPRRRASSANLLSVFVAGKPQTLHLPDLIITRYSYSIAARVFTGL